MRPAVIANCYAMVLLHNHPSGDPTPSEADRALTRRIRESADLLQIHLLDHVIVGQPRDNMPGYFSFKEHGLL
jgi:DNA repair protein RadC